MYLVRHGDRGGGTVAVFAEDQVGLAAALAVHIMSNTALTGATYDIDGGQQFVSS